jgi:autotransporter-associated beta strand protein
LADTSIIMDTFRSVLARAVTVTATAVILLSGATVAPAAAAMRTWVGVSGGSWSEPTNWNPVGAPVNGDILVFDNSGGASSVNDLSLTVNTITFTANHTVTGAAIEVMSGVTSTAGNAFLNISVTLGGNQTWEVPLGTLSVAQLNLNGHTWTVLTGGTIGALDVSGTGAIVTSGSGDLELPNDNSFSGPVTIGSGVVIRTPLGLGTADGTPGNGTTVNAGGQLQVVSNAPLTIANEALTLSGAGGGFGALYAASSDPVIFTGPITLAATATISGSINPSDNHTMVFNGSVNGPGELRIRDYTVAEFANLTNTVPAIDFVFLQVGGLRVGFPQSLANTRINLPALATFDASVAGAEVAGLDGTGTVSLGATPGTLTVRNTLPSEFTGTITGTGGMLIKDGPGTLTLGGVNTYGGPTRVDAGVLRVTTGQALGAAGGTQDTGTSVLDNATLALDNVTLTDERIHVGGTTQAGILQVMGPNPSSTLGPVVMTQMAAINGTHGSALFVNGPLTIATPITVTNAALVPMSPTNNSIAGPVTVNAGATLMAGAPGVFDTFTEVVLNGGNFALNSRQVIVRSLTGNGVVDYGTGGGLHVVPTVDGTFAGTSTGTGVLAKSGDKAWTLTNAVGATGNVSVFGGKLILAHAQALQPTPRVNISAAASLVYAVAATVPYQVSIFGAGTTGADGAVQVLGGDVTFTGMFGAGNANGLARVDAPHVLTWTGPMFVPTLHIGGTGAAVFGAAGYAIPLLRIGVNALNEPAGPATVRPGVAGALAPLDVYVGAGATFDLNGFDLTVSDVSGTGTVAIGARTLTMLQASTFDGSFTGTGAIDASAAGLVVNGTSTFSGTVTAGLFSNGGTLPASVHVTDSNMTLLANSVTGPISVASGPEVFLFIGSEQGAAAGATSGNVNLPASAFTGAYVHNAAALTVHGTVTLAGHLNAYLHPGVSTPGDVLMLIDNDGTDPVVGTFVDKAEGATVHVDGMNSYRISYVGGTGNDVTLTRGEATYFLSEGATGAFFDTDLLIANPNQETADVSVSFYKEGGEVEIFQYQIPALSRLTIRVDNLADMESATFSTEVRSLNPARKLIVERTMRWDATGYGAHTEKATSGPALTWYFAEGSEGSFFRTYLLLANPDPQPNVATVTYLREGEPSIVRTYDLVSLSRRTIQAGDDSELVDRSFGITVTFAQRGIAERAMYFGTSPIWKGGHESLGETAPSTTWFLAEGATGAGFDTFILVANPNAEPTDVTYTFLSESANPATVTKTIPGLSRLTVNIEAEGLAIPDGPVATQVTATRPVIAERAQYWPQSFDQWTETHNSFGVTAPGLKWGLAEGRAGGPEGYQTYILLANAGTEDAHVQLQFLGDGGSVTPPPVTIDVPAQRRVNVPVAPTGNAGDPATNFGAVITSDKPIVVERALYWNVNGEVWAAGTNATATRLP